MMFFKKIQNQCQLVCSKVDTHPRMVLTILISFGWGFTPAGVNQQPPMHQLRMKPLKPFSGWTKNTSPYLKLLIFFNLFSAPEFFPTSPLPPSHLPPTSQLIFVLTPSPELKSRWSASRSRASVNRASTSRANASKASTSRASVSKASKVSTSRANRANASRASRANVSRASKASVLEAWS
jgi:hypothetical protein